MNRMAEVPKESMRTEETKFPSNAHKYRKESNANESTTAESNSEGKQGGQEEQDATPKKDLSSSVKSKRRSFGKQFVDIFFRNGASPKEIKAYIINEMMSNAYNSDFISYNSPTAISLKGRLTKKYAIKTGTTDNDHWIVGFNPDALLLVWTGKDDNSESTGNYSKITKNIWADTIEESLKENKNTWYEMPNNIIGIPLDPLTGNFVTTGKNTMYYFVKGSEPKYYYNEQLSK